MTLNQTSTVQKEKKSLFGTRKIHYGIFILIVVLFSVCRVREGYAAVTVFAAVSLIDVLEAISHAYQQEKEHAVIRFSFAASSVLARQIENGAPADIFLSAHPQWMNRLQTLNHIAAASRAELLGNRLVVIAPREEDDHDLPDDITPRFYLDAPHHWLMRLGTYDRLAIGDPDHVPAGMYAQAALRYFGLWSVVRDRLARTDHVRGALNLVSRGEVPLGIVYATDARISEHVRLIGVFPETSHDPIRYSIGITIGRSREEVQEFYHHLLGETARQLYRHYGFTLPN